MYLHNNLTHLDKDIFKNLTNLQELYLYSNNLTYLDKDIFKYLINLQILYLSNNNLTEFR
jgi:Leucine-rich repeat (LRR) protein